MYEGGFVLTQYVDQEHIDLSPLAEALTLERFQCFNPTLWLKRPAQSSFRERSSVWKVSWPRTALKTQVSSHDLCNFSYWRPHSLARLRPLARRATSKCCSTVSAPSLMRPLLRPWIEWWCAARARVTRLKWYGASMPPSLSPVGTSPWLPSTSRQCASEHSRAVTLIRCRPCSPATGELTSVTAPVTRRFTCS